MSAQPVWLSSGIPGTENYSGTNSYMALSVKLQRAASWLLTRQLTNFFELGNTSCRKLEKNTHTNNKKKNHSPKNPKTNPQTKPRLTPRVFKVWGLQHQLGSSLQIFLQHNCHPNEASIALSHDSSEHSSEVSESERG